MASSSEKLAEKAAMSQSGLAIHPEALSSLPVHRHNRLVRILSRRRDHKTLSRKVAKGFSHSGRRDGQERSTIFETFKKIAHISPTRVQHLLRAGNVRHERRQSACPGIRAVRFRPVQYS